MLLSIVEELGITMSQFFDEYNTNPILTYEILTLAKKLDKTSLDSVISVMKNLSK